MLMIIACLTMLADHIGGHVLDVPAMRIIGRLAMPIYAYLIAGSFEHTRDRKLYLGKMICNAAVSQIPFMIMTGSFKLNICFTWTISILVLICFEDTAANRNKSLFPITVLLSASCIVPMDYGVFALLWVMIFYLRKKMKDSYGDAVLMIGAVMICCVWGVPMQFASLFALPVIFLCERYGLVRLKNKYAVSVYRIFYPVHMMIIDVYNLV